MNNYKNPRFGSRLNDLIITHGLSPPEFAVLMNVNQSTVYRWLNGYVPTVNMLNHIAQYFHTDIAYLLSITERRSQ